MSLKSDYEQRKKDREPKKVSWFAREQTIPLCALGVSFVTAFVAAQGFLLNRDALVASNRALVAPEEGRWTSPPTNGQPFGLTVYYKNIGKEPARNLTFYQESLLASIKRDGTSALFELPLGNVCDKVIEGDGNTIFPFTSSHYSLGLSPKKDIPLDPSVEKKEKVLFWRGCFKYETYRARHFTAFCYWLKSEDNTPLSAWQWNFCPLGNDYD